MRLLFAASAFFFAAVAVVASQTCNKNNCDGLPAKDLLDTTKVTTYVRYGRRMTLHGERERNMVYAHLENGSTGDEIWFNRWWEFTAQPNDGKRIGVKKIPENATEVVTDAFNIDGDVDRPNNQNVGYVQICMKPNGYYLPDCSGWYRIPVCLKICDNSDRRGISDPVKIDSIHDLQVEVLTSRRKRVIYGHLYNATPGDEIWLDRSWNGGNYWIGFLGQSSVPDGSTEAYTSAFNVDYKVGSPVTATIRVCVRRKGEGVFYTNWLRPPICGKVCDGDDINQLTDTAIAASTVISGRNVEVIASATNVAAYGRISNAQPGDEVWLDRSWEDEKIWGGSVGFSKVPEDQHEVATRVYNYDKEVPVVQTGKLRACGKIGGINDFACTEWTSAPDLQSPVDLQYSGDIYLKST